MDSYETKPLDPRILAEQAVLQHVAPVAALTTGDGEILYLHGRTGRYLELAPGEFERNILKIAREGLRPPLAKALAQAVKTKEVIRCPGLSVKTNGGFINVYSEPGQGSTFKVYLTTG